MEYSNIKELYEVFRVESGIPLFIEDHLERLFSGALKANIVLNVKQEIIRQYIADFLESSETKDGNVRLSFYIDFEKHESVNFEAKFIPHQYPSEELCQHGVSCVLMHSERINPETKMANPGLRNQANDLISRHKVYEALLVNHEGKITEGSRTNVFFIKDNILITAPCEKVLPGIVRKKTLSIAKNSGIEVHFRCLDALQELKNIEGAFITGTSPRILPLKNIEAISFKANHPIIVELMKEFNNIVKQYINTIDC